MAISWTSFMLGLCIGLLGLGVTAYILTVKQTEELNAHHKFFKDYATILDGEISHLEKYVDEKMEVLKNAVMKLHDLDLEFHEHTVKSVNEVIGATEKVTRHFQTTANYIASSSGTLEALHRDFNEQMKLIEINDKRWELIQEHITEKADEPEPYYGDLTDFLEANGITIMIEHWIFKNDVTVTMSNAFGDIKKTFGPYEWHDNQYKIIFSMLEELLKGGQTNEQEMAEGAGASEGGDAWDQAPEPDDVLPGEADGILVREQLEKDRIGDAPEAPAEEA